MTGRFQDKVVLITGGANGIGAGCARVFHREGAKAILIIDKDEDACLRLQADLPSVGWIVHDVCEVKNLQVVIAKLLLVTNQVDCLINNVGWHPEPTPLSNTTIEGFEGLMRRNVTSAMIATQGCLPLLKESRGTIINMSSVVALVGENESSAYAATKAALNGLTVSWAIEFAPHGIRVNSVAPSSVDTPLMKSWLDSCPNRLEAEAQERQMHLLRRFATPEEIGNVCLFLATDDSSFMTGQIIQVEGGCTLLHPRSA